MGFSPGIFLGTRTFLFVEIRFVRHCLAPAPVQPQPEPAPINNESVCGGRRVFYTVYSTFCVMRILVTILAGLLGLAFGSFLNVCLSRWPAGESAVKPRSHCRACGRTLSWWENVPVVSWLALGGKCRTCGARISVRYVLVEAAVGALWAYVVWQFLPVILDLDIAAVDSYERIVKMLGTMLLIFLLIALAMLDAEHLWLPDWLTLPGIVLGILYTMGAGYLLYHSSTNDTLSGKPVNVAIGLALSILVASGLVVLIRWVYWLVRRKEGIGFGDVKLMALLAAWLGLPGALLAFFLGVLIGALAALGMLLMPKHGGETWATTKLPLGTFLCIGGIVSSLWGQKLIEVYLHWAGF
jgi:leader peptidase (prepilin peptidase)/N-methyltransferase